MGDVLPFHKLARNQYYQTCRQHRMTTDKLGSELQVFNTKKPDESLHFIKKKLIVKVESGVLFRSERGNFTVEWVPFNVGIYAYTSPRLARRKTPQ